MTASKPVDTMRQSTLETMGLGTVLDMFRNGAMPVTTEELVERVFGPPDNRGSMVITGANGIVGAGKTMQFASRLIDYGVRLVALDFPGSPDGLGKQYPGLVRAFGRDRAAEIMGNVVQLTYDGKSLPDELKQLNPKFLLEAIPEILDVKRAHYETFRATFPDIEIRSVTSGFPSSELGVGISHPAFPHEINKIFEVVEEKPSDITRLMWSLGLIPLEVSDNWAFVLDVLFCGITNAAIQYHQVSNMPYWKIDKFVRRLAGPNPFRAHDVIGAKGANFLTWSCLHHLGEQYGALFSPTTDLISHKDTGRDWYPPNHFRPMVDWSLDGEAEEEFNTWILGPLFQMTCLMVKEKRSHFAQLNIIGEVCAQFRKGTLALMRAMGPDGVRATVEKYHKLFPAAAETEWYPEVLDQIESPEWRQLYVNAECEGDVGVITLGRESYNYDVDAELNRAIDWLKERGVGNVILTGDFHLTTQLVGADISEFYPAMEDEAAGTRVSNDWSRTARRIADEFATSVGVVTGKRCLGGMLELMLHCDYLVATNETSLGFPEVTLPVIPGMEGCHWPFRKTDAEGQTRLLQMLLGGRQVKATDCLSWLIDATGSVEEMLKTAWSIVTGGDHGIPRRATESGALSELPTDVPGLSPGSDSTQEARNAIRACVDASCRVPLEEAIDIQSKHSGAFMVTSVCRKGIVGTDYTKNVKI